MAVYVTFLGEEYLIMSDDLTKYDGVSKSWFCVFDNPQDHNYEGEPQEVIERLRDEWISGSDTRTGAWVFCVSAKGLRHIHMVLEDTKAMRFSAIKKAYAPGTHFEPTRGTKQQAEDYIYKRGKFAEEGEEVLAFVQHGEIKGVQGQRRDLIGLYDMISSGMSNYDIIQDNPLYMFYVDKIEKVRQMILEEKYKDSWRDVDVTYIWGLTRSGKTRSVMEQYGYSNVYRVTDYLHPFDSYRGQDVILFEEFRSSLIIDDMLKFLDGYPVEFPARYMNRQACFTKVYFATNIDLRCQYPNIQEVQPMTWQAFIKRIHRVKVYTGNEVVEMETEKYLKEYFPFFGESPFDKDEGVDE